MNATDVRPEVASFVARVREHLADLTEDEREELVGGLEADLSEQLAEGGTLPDPVAYAAELRVAAGLPARGRRLRLPAGNLLDRARDQWLGWTQYNEATRQAWTLGEALRPAWWVLRAWIAVTLLDQLVGPWEFVTLWPTLGSPVIGPAVLVAAIVVSALVGLGRLWPGAGPDRSPSARVVLLVLNVLAVLAPLTFTGDGSQQYFYTPNASAVAVPSPTGPDVLRHGPDVIRNIYAYDALGQPLTGVQLFDQKGRQVAVSPDSSLGQGNERQVTCPWVNGGTSLFNVFPLQQRTQRRGNCLGEVDPSRVGLPALQAPPLASVPPVALPDGTQGVSSPTGTPTETVLPSGASGQAQAGS